MNEVSDFTDIFLRDAHSSDDDWNCWAEFQVAPFGLDYVFEKLESHCLLVQRIESPLVLTEHIDQALNTLAEFKKHYNTPVRMMLVYGGLLAKPKNLPKDVVVVTINEGEIDILEANSFEFSLN